MTFLNQTQNTNTEAEERSEAHKSWPFVLCSIIVLSGAGWTHLIAMVADMIPQMDMSTAGPGMIVFNQFNFLANLPTEARAALSILCLPAGSSFGMPSIELGLQDQIKILLMWVMMALAMMLPSAVPMIRKYTFSNARATTRKQAVACSILLLLGYLVAWLGYALVATAFQVSLTKLGALSDMMAPVNAALTISVLFVAGLYQFTPAKQACLWRCWYPRWHFSIAGENRNGVNSLKEGLYQGFLCLGCCWAAMTVMFAVGVMNVLWIVILGTIMSVEKTLPSKLLPKLIGAFLICWSALIFLVRT